MTRLLLHPVTAAVLCLTLLGAPVTYRGGASEAHPHMFLEFMLDASDGHFDHHHHGEAGEMTGHDDEHRSGEQTEAAAPDPAGPSAATAGQSAAMLTAFVVGDVAQASMTLPQQSLPERAGVNLALIRNDRVPPGNTTAPTAPPPR